MSALKSKRNTNQLYFLLFFIVLSSACSIVKTGQHTKFNATTIRGNIDNFEYQKIVIKNTNTEKKYLINVDKKGRFNAEIDIEKSAFFAFENEEGEFICDAFFSPKDQINMTFDAKRYFESIIFEGSPASSGIATLNKITDDLVEGKTFYKSKTPEEYNLKVTESIDLLTKEVAPVKDSLFLDFITPYLEGGWFPSYLKEGYLAEYKTFTNYEEDAVSYLVSKSDLKLDYLFDAWYQELDSMSYFDKLNEFQNNAYALLESVNDKKFIATEKLKIEEYINKWETEWRVYDNVPKRGEELVDAEFVDIKGEIHSLSSFKNKIVYIDIWATWCRPCIASLPSLEKLEKEYKDKGIIFLSISIDRKKKSWEKMLKEKKLTGLQLWAEKENSFYKDYAISKIPRFMLLSADGKIISSDAPKPGSEEIRELIDLNLK